MTVSKWVNRAYPVYRGSETVEKVAREEKTLGFSTIVVMDDNDKLLGTVSAERISGEDRSKKLEEFIVESPYFCLVDDYIEDAVLMLIESRDFVLPVIDDRSRVLGAITVYEILEALMEFTAMDRSGCRISMLLEDVPGSLKGVVDALAESEINILSIVTTTQEDSRKRVVIRTSDTDIGKIAEALEGSTAMLESITEEEGFSA
jgi:acetoin utilization protein AcuB